MRKRKIMTEESKRAEISRQFGKFRAAPYKQVPSTAAMRVGRPSAATTTTGISVCTMSLSK